MKHIEPDIEMQIYRNNINELQGQLQEAYKRIKELTDEVNKLKKQRLPRCGSI
jgi:predicted RNase H-like nuclease (RuvC/YqgF family)|tara:strand:- start:1319 stop:1477 length:159 start_codon:yes stop_codon:yes gene_type:complete